VVGVEVGEEIGGCWWRAESLVLHRDPT